MEKSTKLLTCAFGIAAALFGAMMYVTAEVSNTIETMYIDVKGIPSAKSEIIITHRDSSKYFRDTNYVRNIYGAGVIILERVPDGNYTVRIPTEKCKPKSPTIAEYQGNRGGIYYAAFVVSDYRRWIRLKTVVFLVDLDTCKTHLESVRSSGWKWGF